MPNLKYNECRRQCRYNYTPQERLEKGRLLADEYQELDSSNTGLERVKKQYKAQIESHEAAIAKLAEQVRSGYEMREMLCFWEYNIPKPGRKTLRRADNIFEVVGEEDMTGEDTQMVMEALDAEAAGAKKTDADAGGVKPQPVLALPALHETEPSPDPKKKRAPKNKKAPKTGGSANKPAESADDDIPPPPDDIYEGAPAPDDDINFDNDIDDFNNG